MEPCFEYVIGLIVRAAKADQDEQTAGLEEVPEEKKKENMRNQSMRNVFSSLVSKEEALVYLRREGEEGLLAEFPYAGRDGYVCADPLGVSARFQECPEGMLTFWADVCEEGTMCGFELSGLTGLTGRVSGISGKWSPPASLASCCCPLKNPSRLAHPSFLPRLPSIPSHPFVKVHTTSETGSSVSLPETTPSTDHSLVKNLCSAGS